MWRRSKFNAVKVRLDGFTFDSKMEAARYQAVKLWVAAGEIRDLCVHPRYHFRINDVEIVYVADLEYEARDVNGDWHLITEDTKGFRTPEYKIKAKLFRGFVGRSILETK